MNAETAHALIRFGLGRRGAEPLPDDPHGWLAAQLEGPDSFPAENRPSTASALNAIAQEDAANRAQTKPPPKFIGTMFESDRNVAFKHAIDTDQPFRERLVLFWTNHFTVSARAGGGVLALLGAFAQEAIRPHVTGRFADMLGAVMTHPAMLYYLSNDDSVGPNSQAGLNNHGGLNENLARECLELHTVGLGAGYSQADVTNFAKLLTGWSVDRNVPQTGFVFRPAWHEPGPQTLMGQSFPEGQAGGEAALRFLANHPATQRHLATQLVGHFVGDAPAEADIAQIAGVLRNTGGDLKAAALAVTHLPNAWQPLTKLRTPIDYTLALYRALDLPEVKYDVAVWSNWHLGENFWTAPLPNGWSDKAADWTSGELLIRRADWAWTLAGEAGAPIADDVAARTLGDLLTAGTRDKVAAAASRRDALALLLASPEFMRR